jgi:murein DD-endopeptidase MepM/ murein hydrolase activator NlpD
VDALALLDWHTRAAEPPTRREIWVGRLRSAQAQARTAQDAALRFARALLLVLAGLLGDALRGARRARRTPPPTRGAHARPGLDVRLGAHTAAGRHSRRNPFTPSGRPASRHRVPTAPPEIRMRRLFAVLGVAAVIVIVAATYAPAPAAIEVAARGIRTAESVQVGRRTGAMEVSALQLRSLTTAVTVATAALVRARSQLAYEQDAQRAARVRMVDVSRVMFVDAAPDAPAGGVLGEFGITSEQECARMIAEVITAERMASERVVAARALVRRADVVLAVRKGELSAEQRRQAALRKAAEARARAAAERRNAGLPGSSARFGGGLLRPVSAPMSSTFGMRYDPYYHVSQLHAGIDLAAASGTPIRAAADGWVQRAGWNGGYGNYTCISHGTTSRGRMSTCYGHQSSIGVRAGQHVTRGQVIGRVGTTGASTGAHLHFEVRLDGRPVDPLDWL